MAQQGFDISKYITAADIVSAVTAGTIAYLTYKTKQDEPKPEQPQGQQPQGQATPTTGSKATNFYDEVPDVPEMTPQDNSMVKWGRSWYSERGFNNCSTGNDILFPSKWQVEDFAEQIGCEPGKLQALLDKGAGEKMFAKLMSLGQTGNFSAGRFNSLLGFTALHLFERSGQNECFSAEKHIFRNFLFLILHCQSGRFQLFQQIPDGLPMQGSIQIFGHHFAEALDL